jgi:hypothetical protein
MTMKHTLETAKQTVSANNGYAFFSANELDDDVIQELKNSGYLVQSNALEISPGEWIETIDVERIES